MKDIIVTIGADTYKVVDVVERPADRSLYGAGMYVYLENTNLEQYPTNLQWRAKCEVVIKPGSNEYRFIAWNMGITLGTMYNSRIDQAIVLYNERKAQEALNASI